MEADDRGIAKSLGVVAHHRCSFATSPIQGYLDLVEGLAFPRESAFSRSTEGDGGDQEPGASILCAFANLVLIFYVFYHCLRVLASEHMSKSKGAATPNLPSYSTKLVRRGSIASGRKHCNTKLLRKLPSIGIKYLIFELRVGPGKRLSVPGRLGAVPELFGCILGCLGPVLGRLGAVFGLCRCRSSASWEIQGPFWSLFGLCWAPRLTCGFLWPS